MFSLLVLRENFKEMGVNPHFMNEKVKTHTGCFLSQSNPQLFRYRVTMLRLHHLPIPFTGLN